MADVFDEVEEQIRSDRYKTFASKAAPWVIAALALALAAALGWWGFDHYRAKQNAAASESYAAAVETLAKGDKTGAVEKLQALSAKGPPIYRTLALMHLGGVAMDEGKTVDAVARFDAAAKTAPDESLADLARLKSALALLDTASYADLEARLTPLTAEKRAYRIPAKEALAFAKLAAGKVDAARSDFSVLALLGDSSDAVRERARIAMEMIDSGSAKTLPAVAKAAAALPPAPMMPAGPQLAPGPAQ